MLSRQAEIKKIITQLQHQIKIPSHIEYEVALNAEDERVNAISNMPHADELFSNNVLSLDHLRNAKSLAEMNNIIDNYLAVIDFYRQHYNQFSSIITQPFFQDLINKKGDLHCWNELITHSFHKLHSSQFTTLIIDALTRLKSLGEAREEVEEDRTSRPTFR